MKYIGSLMFNKPTFPTMAKPKLLYSLLVLTILSCSSPKALEYKTYHNFSVEKLGFNSSAIKLDLEYYNPNNFGMQLKNSDLDIFIDGTLLGHSSFDTLITIPRRNTFILPIKFDVDMQNIFKNAWSTLTGKEVLVRLTGRLKIGKANVFMSMPVNYETKETFSMF
jgi:LEA14-like dessication related protein